MIFPGVSTVRRLMRRHQGLPETPASAHHLPMWRLLLGEVRWTVAQLWAEPRVGGALVVGAVVTLAVLGAAAPGPVLPWPGRVVVALLAGLAIARGVWAVIRRRGRAERGVTEAVPAVAATEFVAIVVVAVLMVWLLAWLVLLVV